MSWFICLIFNVSHKKWTAVETIETAKRIVRWLTGWHWPTYLLVSKKQANWKQTNIALRISFKITLWHIKWPFCLGHFDQFQFNNFFQWPLTGWPFFQYKLKFKENTEAGAINKQFETNHLWIVQLSVSNHYGFGSDFSPSPPFPAAAIHHLAYSVLSCFQSFAMMRFGFWPRFLIHFSAI